MVDGEVLGWFEEEIGVGVIMEVGGVDGDTDTIKRMIIKRRIIMIKATTAMRTFLSFKNARFG